MSHKLWHGCPERIFVGPDQKSGARTGPRKSGPKNPDHIIYPDRSGFLVQSGQPWLMTSYFSYQSLERLQFWKDSHWIWSDEFHWPTASSRILINWQNFCHSSQILTNLISGTSGSRRNRKWLLNLVRQTSKMLAWRPSRKIQIFSIWKRWIHHQVCIFFLLCPFYPYSDWSMVFKLACRWTWTSSWRQTWKRTWEDLFSCKSYARK